MDQESLPISYRSFTALPKSSKNLRCNSELDSQDCLIVSTNYARAERLESYQTCYWSDESFSGHSLVENNKPHEMQNLGI